MESSTYSRVQGLGSGTLSKWVIIWLTGVISILTKRPWPSKLGLRA